MTRVHLVTEDRTGGGLEAVLRAEAEHQRSLCGKARLQFSARPSTVNGNAELLKQCEKYELFRFNYSPRCDHVFYVIDARNAWDLPQLGVQAPSPPYEESLPAFTHAICGRMAGIARGSRTEQQWAAISGGFHAHVLVWERESLILPVADRLGLGGAVKEVYTARRAAEFVGELFRSRGKRRKYDKAIDGSDYLQRIADDEHLRAIVFASNPSLRVILDEIVSL